MAKNTENRRIPVKHVRDKAKAAYDKKDVCYICNCKEDLELHHFHSVTILLETWANAKNYDISTDDGILSVRDEFIADHKFELYDQVRTLCNKHHVNLHKIFGKAPTSSSVPKQVRWVDIQKDKFSGVEVNNKTVNNSSFFSAFT
jgi:hypothetical protein